MSVCVCVCVWWGGFNVLRLVRKCSTLLHRAGENFELGCVIGVLRGRNTDDGQGWIAAGIVF